MCEMYFEYKNKNSNITVVFLHGWGLNSNCFDKIIANLNNVSILKLDLFGFGKSSMPKDYFDTYEYSYQIFLLLKKLDVNNIVLVGHSFGGRLSILLSSIFGLNVKTTLLTSSAGLNRFSFATFIKVKFYKMIKWLCCVGYCNQKLINIFGSVDYKNANKCLRKVMISVVNQDLSHCARLMKNKVVLVWDKKDVDTKYWICKKLNKLINGSMVVLYDSGGHFAIFYNVYKFVNLLYKCI